MSPKSHKNSTSKRDRKDLHKRDDDNIRENISEVEKDLNNTNESLTLPSDDIDDKASRILTEDGYLVDRPEQVIKVGSKVGTDYNFTNIKSGDMDERQDYQSNLTGKKDYSANSTSIQDLKKQFGFSWKSFSRKFAFFGLIFGIFMIVSVSTVAALAINKWNETKPIDDLLNQKRESSVVYARDGVTKIFEVYEDEKREYVDIDEIPEHVQLAVIAIEDDGFYYNDVGIPWKNLFGATVKCLISAGDECRGASGIAQQTVKLATDKNRPSDRTIETKIDELFTAIKLSNSGKTKADILESYLNIAPFGGVTHGVQSASRTYFGKDVQDINVVEGCFLAPLLNQPSTYSSSIGLPESNAWKAFNNVKDKCLENMHTMNLRGDGEEVFIKTPEELIALQETPIVVASTQAEVEQARANGAVVFVPNQETDEFPHFREYVLAELRKFIPREQELYTKGYQIVTTLDPIKHREIEKILKESEQNNVIANGGNNAAAVVLDGPSGEIISMVGSLGYNRADINGKVNIMTSPQQPGSSIKPYVYATALSKGFNPATMVVDTPTEFQPGYKPKNFDNTTQGPVSFRSAIQNSLNIPTIKFACLSSNNAQLDCNEGIKQVFDFSEQTGLRFACYPPADNFSKKDADGNFIKQCDDPDLAKSAYRDRCFLSSAVGGCEIIPVSHATGMNTILQEGNLRTATPFLSIKDNTGRELYTQETKQSVYPSQDKAIDPLIAKQMANVLSDYNARRPKFGSAARTLEINECGNGAQVGGAAAKTGTTNDVKDTWTVGGCTNYTTVVWVGRTDNESMKQNATSSTAAAPVWNKIMKYLVNGENPAAFSTEGLLRVGVNPATGMIGGGGSEYMSPSQKQVLEDAEERISTPDYTPGSKNIFDFRSAVISQEVLINKLDGLLATTQTLEENIEKKTCLQLLPEFPGSQSWAIPVNAISAKFPEVYCTPPTEPSPQDQVGEQTKSPLIQSNLDNSKANISTISFNVTPQGQEGKTIQSMQIIIQGSGRSIPVPSPSSNNTYSTTVNISDLGISTNPNDIILRATDNFGATAEKTYSNVTFSFTPTNPLQLSDIATLNCSGNIVNNGKTTKCTFAIPSAKTLPVGFGISIGNAAETSSCTPISSNVISCDNVPVPSVNGSAEIKVRLGNGSSLQSTGKTVSVVS
ncbi:MAG: transglycosylase domain-containing protein [Patescibacteria group bacterium]